VLVPTIPAAYFAWMDDGASGGSGRAAGGGSVVGGGGGSGGGAAADGDGDDVDTAITIASTAAAATAATIAAAVRVQQVAAFRSWTGLARLLAMEHIGACLKYARSGSAGCVEATVVIFAMFLTRVGKSRHEMLNVR
jgi:hypothetical protein